MRAPTNERQALERERAELQRQISAYQRELDATTVEQRARRERLEWQIEVSRIRRRGTVEPEGAASRERLLPFGRLRVLKGAPPDAPDPSRASALPAQQAFRQPEQFRDQHARRRGGELEKAARIKQQLGG